MLFIAVVFFSHRREILTDLAVYCFRAHYSYAITRNLRPILNLPGPNHDKRKPFMNQIKLLVVTNVFVSDQNYFSDHKHILFESTLWENRSYPTETRAIRTGLSSKVLFALISRVSEISWMQIKWYGAFTKVFDGVFKLSDVNTIKLSSEINSVSASMLLTGRITIKHGTEPRYRTGLSSAITCKHQRTRTFYLSTHLLLICNKGARSNSRRRIHYIHLRR